MTDVDRSVVATCPLGISAQGTGLSGVRAGHLAAPAIGSIGSVDSVSLLASERLLGSNGGNERPTKALEAAVVAQAQAYAFAAAGAGFRKQTTTQHMWAFRGLEPWSDPA
ncbi:hypothetical protein ACIBI4_23380 [Streptomyces sp. NPDC050418]|uniref:hypothetical protein n=1 Tax=Streptomyces sp. NPDC050418 TaxID=3365612 RepID=UPI0037ACD3B0